MTIHPLKSRTRRETGSAAVELVLVTPLLVVLALIAAAFGRVADTRIRVEDAAHHAARAASLTHTTREADRAAREAAAQALDLDALREGTGPPRLNPQQATAAARAYAAAIGDTSQVRATHTTVTVTVTHQVDTQVLCLVGLGHLTATGTATARAERATTLQAGTIP